jgi:hypothetical protein
MLFDFGIFGRLQKAVDDVTRKFPGERRHSEHILETKMLLIFCMM